MSPGSAIAEHVVTVLRDRGIEPDEHVPTPVEHRDLGSYDTIVSLAPNVARELLEHHGLADVRERLLEWDVADPFQGSPEDYEQTARELSQLLTRHRDQLLVARGATSLVAPATRSLAARIDKWKVELRTAKPEPTRLKGIHSFSFGLFEEDLRPVLGRLAARLARRVEDHTDGRAVEALPLGTAVGLAKWLAPSMSLVALDPLPSLRNTFSHSGAVPSNDELLRCLEALETALPIVSALDDVR